MSEPVALLTFLFIGNAVLAFIFIAYGYPTLVKILESRNETICKNLKLLLEKQGTCPTCGHKRTEVSRNGIAANPARTVSTQEETYPANDKA